MKGTRYSPRNLSGNGDGKSSSSKGESQACDVLPYRGGGGSADTSGQARLSDWIVRHGA
jgi:hypothetical protein